MAASAVFQRLGHEWGARVTRRSSRLDGARWDKPDTAAKKIQVFPPAVYARVDRYPYLVRRLSYPLAIHVAVALEEPEPELDLDDEEQLQAYEAAYFHQRQIDAEMRKPPGERNFGTSTAYTESDDGSEGVRRSLEWRKRVAEDFLRQRGWRIVHAGSTGNDRGRPSKGLEGGRAHRGTHRAAPGRLRARGAHTAPPGQADARASEAARSTRRHRGEDREAG